MKLGVVKGSTGSLDGGYKKAENAKLVWRVWKKFSFLTNFRTSNHCITRAANDPFRDQIIAALLKILHWLPNSQHKIKPEFLPRFRTRLGQVMSPSWSPTTLPTGSLLSSYNGLLVSPQTCLHYLLESLSGRLFHTTNQQAPSLPSSLWGNVTLSKTSLTVL